MKTLDFSNGEKLARAIDKRITRVAQQVFENSPMNKSKFGKVVSVKGDHFSVLIDNTTYTKVPALTNIGRISVGDVVLCLVPNNQFSNLTIVGIISSSVKKQTETSGLPLGLIIPSAVVSDDSNLHLLDGSSLSQGGVYAQFCTWLKNRALMNSNNVPICTIDEYATQMNTYSQCGRFVINDTAQTIRSGNYSVPPNSIKLPTITEFVGSNNGGDAIGLAELDMFSSHTHQIYSTTDSGGLYRWATNAGGAATYVGVVGATETYYSGGLLLANKNTGGQETRPKNIRYPYYIVVATSLKDEAFINAEGVVGEINNIKDVLSRTEQVEVFYHNESNDININWRMGGGIPGGIVLSEPHDFSKFKRIYVYSTQLGSHLITMVDLQQIGHNSSSGALAYYGMSAGLATDEKALMTIKCYVSQDKQTFYVEDIGYWNTSGYVSRNENGDYVVYKIEGVY